MALRRLLDEETGEYLDVDLDDGLESSPDKSRTNSEWAQLRQANKKAEKAEADAAAVRKELMFAKVGLDTADPRVSDFYKAYDGEVTADAVRAAAQSRGYLSEPGEAQPEEQAPDTAALAAASRMASAAAGATPDLRTDQARMVDAFETGGPDALQDYLRGLGFAVVVEGQT